MEEFFSIIYYICFGLLISGAILTVLSFILAGLSFDIDDDIVHDISADIDGDLDLEIDMDINSELDIDTDLDIDVNTESDMDAFNSMSITPAPSMLLLSSFILFTGVLGVALFDLFSEKIIWLIIISTIPYLFTKLVSKLWKKIAISKSYQILARRNLIGKKAIVSLNIDEKGGIIKVPTKTPIKFEKFPAKPLYSLSKFKVNEEVYICDMNENYYLIDKNKESINWRLLKKKDVISRN